MKQYGRASREEVSTVKQLQWVKASASSGNGNCVEVASLGLDGVLVRDSKSPDGPKLIFSREEFSAFKDGVRNYEFDFS